jgi:starch synthase
VAPLAKTGGLGDVTAALAEHLGRRGHDVRLFLPLYRRVRDGIENLEPVPGLQHMAVELGPRAYHVAVLKGRAPGGGPEVWCVDCPPLYDRPDIYSGEGDEHRRFALLGRAALAACQQTAWAPDVVHAHDWHVALLPLYVKLLSSWEKLFARTKTVLTIHNIGYQGLFGKDCVHDLGLDDAVHLLHQEDLDRGRVGFLKTGLIYADVITTVSRTYAREIQTDEFGMGLQDLLRARSDRLVGIVNGVDYDTWSPEADTLIPRNYSADSLDDKAVNREALLKGMGLDASPGVPVFGLVSRLVHQKGIELLFDVLPEMLGAVDARLCVLGSGEPRFEEFFTALQHRFPGRVCFYQGYSNELAHLIEAGADAFLMPSLFEPCGLNQMYSLRYGTVPIVRRTGGLADTVQLFDRSTGEGTGIVFDHAEPEAVRRALAYALELYHDPPAWRRMMLNGMAQDFSWDRQVQLYEELYHRLCA